MSTIPKTMRAAVLVGHGGLDKLELRHDWPVPVPKKGQVLIQIHACGLNNTDVNTRTGWYSKEVSPSGDYSGWGGAAMSFPRIQGADVAGRVVSVGDEADGSLIGKRVMVDTWLRDWNDPLNFGKAIFFGSECDGGFAEYTVVDQRQVHPIESALSDAELATFATSYNTAENMLHRANVAKGDTVLITGASGGVGSALIQLARRRGAITIAMCGDAKREQVEAIGPDAVLPRVPANLGASLKEAIGQEKVTVIADVVGGPFWPNLIEALVCGGRYTCAGAVAGPIVNFDLRTFYLNDLTFTGATVTPPDAFANLVGYIERGEVKPLLAATYPLEKIHEAQQTFIDKHHVGNIVVTM